MARSTLLANVGVGVVACAITALAVEGLLRVAYPMSESYRILPANRHQVFDPADNLQGITGPADYVTNSLGIRGPEFDPGDRYRILAIGGSTTQNPYLDTDESWPLLLGPRLSERFPAVPTWSGDVGRSGHTARSHVLQLRHFAAQVPELDAVVMLIGFNDAAAALRGGFAPPRRPPLSDPEALRRQMSQAFVQVPGRLHDRQTAYRGDNVSPLKRTALYQLATLVRDRLSAAGTNERQDASGEVFDVWRSHRATARVLHDSLPDLAVALDDYQSQVETIATVADSLGLRLILVTPPALWREDLAPFEEALLWFGGIGDFQAAPGSEYFTSGALTRALDAFNDRLLSVCTDRRLECLDLAVTMPRDTTVFFDDVHFTERGSELAAAALVDLLAMRDPYPPGS